VDDQKTEVPNATSTMEDVIWDPVDTACFCATDIKNSKTVTTYSYSAQTVKGSVVTKIATTKVITITITITITVTITITITFTITITGAARVRVHLHVRRHGARPEPAGYTLMTLA
jgi:hypothetical protein